MKVDLHLLQEENNSLIHRITQMQQIRWRMEEHIKDLETHNKQLSAAADQKSRIIRDYVMTAKAGRSEMHRDLHREDPRLANLASTAATPQLLAKMEEVLEDTLLRNIQLKNDLEVLGNEVESLRVQNEDLKKDLKKLASR